MALPRDDDKPIVLFRRCLGFTDARAFGTQKMVTDPRLAEAGYTELIDCLNLTTTSDGCLEKLAPLLPILDTGAPITDLSAGSRLMFNDGTNVKEWTGGAAIVNRFPGTVGPIAHTMLDVRLPGFKSTNVAGAMQASLVGQYTGPTVTTPWAPMPLFKQAFVYNAKAYAINAADPRFLQFSEDYAYDLFNLGDNHIGSPFTILQAGAIPGALITTHAEGVTVYTGTGPHDFEKKFYPCPVIDNTLHSGLISKAFGHNHIFLCDDGLYAVEPNGKLSNLTINQVTRIDSLNSSYICSTVRDGKYLAFGNTLCIEYDVVLKTLLKRSTFGVTGACIWKGSNYFAVGNNLVTEGTEIDTTSAFPCSLTLPHSDLSNPGTKSIECLYFTGTLKGILTITATGQQGKSWIKEISADLVAVSNYRIKTPKGLLGNHISFKLNCTAGAFRLEELTAVVTASKRSR